MENKGKILELDSLRGIAAVLVMLFHYSIGFNPQDTKYIFHYGYLGVLLFFIISGFVISMSLEGKTLRQFIKSRFLRLYPLYWIAIGFSLILMFSATFLHLQGPLAIDSITFTQLNGNLTMFQHWLGLPDFNGVFWTLTVELNFYVFMGVLLYTRMLKRIIPLSYLWIIFMLAYKFFALDAQLLFIFQLLRFGNLFIIGIVLYHYYKKRKLNLIEWGLLVLSIATQFYVGGKVEGVAALVFTIIFFLVFKGYLKFLQNKVLLWLGAISYPLYLVHENFGKFTFNVLTRLNIESSTIKGVIAIILVLALVNFVIAPLEGPFTRLINIKIFIGND
jgi:peptidoglycan/LPS O-acetylase OafA/YrhL